MAYTLSFAPEFFLGDGAVPSDELPRSNRPTSVYQALLSLPRHDWAALARDVFGVEPDRLEPETVLEKIHATNTCTSLDAPVEVWIDSEGWYRLLIYDREEASRASRSVAPVSPPAAGEAPLHD